MEFQDASLTAERRPETTLIALSATTPPAGARADGLICMATLEPHAHRLSSAQVLEAEQRHGLR